MSWYHNRPLRLRDIVREKDGRHVGVIIAVVSGLCLVRWDDTGWLSELPHTELERVS